MRAKEGKVHLRSDTRVNGDVPREEDFQLLAIAALLSPLAQIAQAGAPPQRPPDGSYAYALCEGSAAPIYTSTIVIKSNGPTFDVLESVKLPNGATATTTTTWSSASERRVHRRAHQRQSNGTGRAEHLLTTTWWESGGYCFRYQPR
jgi:hypothetical protein